MIFNQDYADGMIVILGEAKNPISSGGSNSNWILRFAQNDKRGIVSVFIRVCS